MKHSISLLTAIVFSVGALQSNAAEGLRLLPDSAKVAGKIGSKFSEVDDATAMRINPANLTYLEEGQFMFSFTALLGETDFVSSAGITDSIEEPWKYLGSLYLATPIEDSNWSIGIGLSAPSGLDMVWDKAGAFQYAIPYDATLEVYSILPTLALQVRDDLSFGLGLDIVYSRMELSQQYPFFLLTGVPGTPDGKFNFNGEGWGVGATAGVTWEPAPNQRIALTGRLPITVDYSGDFEVEGTPAPLAGIIPSRSDFDSEIEFPGSIALGYGIDITDRITVGFDAEWINNSVHEEVPLSIGVNQPLLAGQDAAILDWKDSYNLGTGVEYAVNEKLSLRAGYLYSESPIQNQTFNPVIPANDRHLFSVGFGYRCQNHEINVAYLYGLYEDRTVTDNIIPQFDGDYEFQWDMFTISYTFHF